MSELAFYVRAKYDEAVQMREELARLRSEMMKVDETTEQGKKTMEELAKKYHETSIALNGVVDSASEAALFMKQGVGDTDKAVLDLIHTIKQGENSIQGVFSATREQMSSVVDNLDAAREVYTRVLEETRGKIKELRDLRNAAFSSGNMADGGAYNVQIDKMEAVIREYEAEIKAIDEKKKAAQGEIDQIEVSIGAYEKQADAIKETKDLTEEQARHLEKALGDALDLVLGKTQSFQETVRKVANVYKEAKELADRYSSATGKVAEAAANATRAQTLLHGASLKLGTALVRMGVSANAAKAALALIPGALGVAAISAAIVVITKLIRKHREAKQEAEEARQKTMEYYEEIGKGAAPAIAKFEDLRSKYADLRSEMEKKQFIEDNKKALDSLGVSINNVNDADQLLIDGVDEYVRAQIRYAEADLKRAQAQSKIAQAAALRIQIEEAERTGETKKVKQMVTRAEAHRMTYGEDADTSKLYKPDELIEVKKEVKVADLLKDDLASLEGDIADIYKDITATQKAGDSALQSIASMGPQPLKYEDSIAGKTEAAKKQWDEAKEKVKAMREDAEHYSAEQLKAAEADEATAKKAYESLVGKSSGGSSGGKTSKTAADKEAEKRKTAIESFNKQILAMIRSVGNDIEKEEIAAIESNMEAMSRQMDLEKRVLIEKAEDIGKTMTDLFNGNVDLLNRKTIDAARLTEKGWEDAGDGIATVFSSGYGVKDSRGKMHELLITPILPNGEVLSPQEVENYIDTVLEGAGDFLAADEKGIVIAVDVDEDAGEQLHLMQESYYELKRLIEEYDSVKRQVANAQSIKEITKKEWNEMLSTPEEQDDMEELVSQYGTYEEKRLQIHLKWLGKINAADEEHRKLYERAFAQEMMALEMSADGMLAKVFGNVSKYTKRQIEEARNIANNYIKNNPGMSAEEVERIQRAIDALNDAEFAKKFEVGNSNLMDLVKNLSYLKDLQKQYQEEVEKGDKADKRRMVELSTLIEQQRERLSMDWKAVVVDGIIKSMQKALDVMKQIGNLTNNEKLSEAAEGLGAFAQNLSAAYEGYKSSGSWIGAVVGGVTDLAQQAVEAFEVATAETEEMKHNAEDFAHAMQLAELSVKSTDYSSIFGTDRSGMLKGYAKSAVSSLREYQKEIKNLNDADWTPDEFTEKWEGLGKSIFLPTTGIWGNLMNISARLSGMRTETSNAFTAYQDAIARGMKGLQTMMVKTKDNSGFANFFGIQDEFKALGDIAPEIFGEDGYLDVDNAKLFLQTNTQITEEQRKQIKNAIDLNEKYQEAVDGMKDMLSSIFGDMSSQLADATISGLSRGSMVGADILKQNMGGAVGDLQKMLVEGIYASYLSDYQDEALSILENGGNEEDLVELYGRMIDNISSTAEVAYKAAERFDEIAKEKGFDINRQTNVNASSQSFQQISETTGSAIQGGVTALRLSSEVRNERLSLMSANIDEMLHQQMVATTLAEDIRNIQVDSYLALVAIRDNTAGNLVVVREIADYVAKIEKSTRGLS